MIHIAGLQQITIGFSAYYNKKGPVQQTFRAFDIVSRFLKDKILLWKYRRTSLATNGSFTLANSKSCLIPTKFFQKLKKTNI